MIRAFWRLAAGSVVLASTAVSAQDASGIIESEAEVESRGSASSRLVEEIIVTAQKREENIQDVPISITAFSADKLDAVGIQDAQDLGRVTPGLTFSGTAGYTVVFLRGVGTDAFLPAADPSVPVYVDGIAMLSGQGVQDTLGQVERVEILKGPQGTLFGRNSTGGAVSIVTPRPDTIFASSIKLEAAQKNGRNAVAFANLPFTDTLAANVAAYSNSNDTYYENTAGPTIASYSRGARTKILWQAHEDVSLTLSASIQSNSGTNSLVQENTRPAPVLGAVIPPDPKADRKVAVDEMGGSKSNSYVLSGVLDWTLPRFDSKLIVSDQRVNVTYALYDFDGSTLPIFSFYSTNQFADQRTAELQFLSNDDSPFSDWLKWVAGFYYLEGTGGFPTLYLQLANQGLLTTLPGGAGVQDLLTGFLQNLGLPPLLADSTTLISGGLIESQSVSAYLQGTASLTETLDLTLGARLQRETRDISQSRLGVVNPLTRDEITVFRFEAPEVNADQFAPRVALQWRPAPLVQVYAAWARGFKSPTYNTVNFFSAPDAVKEERVDAYELGFKSDFPDAGLRLNGAVFYTQVEDLLTGFVALGSGGVVRFDNAGNAEIRGAEIDFTWTPMPDANPGLAIVGGATYLDSEYTSYPDGRGFDEATGLAFGDNGLTLLPSRDFAGNRIVRTPEWSYALGVNQALEVGPGTLEIGVDTFYSDKYFYLPQNSSLYATPSYQLLGARVSYFYEPWGLQFTVYGDNLTNENYFTSVFTQDFGRSVTLNDPRIIGLRMKWTLR